MVKRKRRIREFVATLFDPKGAGTRLLVKLVFFVFVTSAVGVWLATRAQRADDPPEVSVRWTWNTGTGHAGLEIGNCGETGLEGVQLRIGEDISEVATVRSPVFSLAPVGKQGSIQEWDVTSFLSLWNIRPDWLASGKTPTVDITGTYATGAGTEQDGADPDGRAIRVMIRQGIGTKP